MAYGTFKFNNKIRNILKSHGCQTETESVEMFPDQTHHLKTTLPQSC